jgi:hypothetical protein
VRLDDHDDHHARRGDAMKTTLVPVTIELKHDDWMRFRTAATALKTTPARLAKWIILAHLMEMPRGARLRGDVARPRGGRRALKGAA